MSHTSWGFFPLVLVAAAIGSCSKASDDEGGDSEVLPNPVVIHVAGMQKGQGGKT